MSTASRTFPWFNGLVRQVAVIVMYVVMIVFNVLANGSFNNTDNAKLADKYRTIITPAGFTFAVWGIIYTLLAVLSIWQVLPTNRASAKLDGLGLPLCAAFGLNALWLVTFAYEKLWTAQLIIFAYAAVLFYCYHVAGVCADPSPEEVSMRTPRAALAEKVCLWMALSANSAWVMVASVVGLSLTLKAAGAPIDDTADWSVAMVCLTAAVCSYFALAKGDVMYTGVTAWALVGVINAPATVQPVPSFCTAMMATVVTCLALGLLNKVVKAKYYPSHLRETSGKLVVLSDAPNPQITG